MAPSRALYTTRRVHYENQPIAQESLDQRSRRRPRLCSTNRQRPNRPALQGFRTARHRNLRRGLRLLPDPAARSRGPHPSLRRLLHHRRPGAGDQRRPGGRFPTIPAWAWSKRSARWSSACKVGDRVMVPGRRNAASAISACKAAPTGASSSPPLRLTPWPRCPTARRSSKARSRRLKRMMVVTEEYCCPVFTDLPSAELTLLGDTVGTGLAAATIWCDRTRLDVVVLGAGPVGLGAIQSAPHRQRRPSHRGRTDPRPAARLP